MMRRASSARRAEEFAAATDGRSAVSTLGDETRAFLTIVEQLRDLETPVMRPDFSVDLRSRLMAAAPDALADLPPVKRETTAPQARQPTTRRQRGLRLVAASCLFVGTAGGVAAASQSALPGDPLYGVKRALEHVQVVTAGSASDRGDTLLDQAATRLAEVQALAVSRADDPATAPLMSDALDDFTDQAQDGASALEDSYDDNQDAADIAHVRDFAEESTQRLVDLGDVVPPEVRDDIAAAAEVLTDIDGSARSACPTCSSLVPLELSASMEALQEQAQGILDLLPGSDEGPEGTDSTAGGQAPSGDLPTLPDGTGDPGGQPPGGGGDPGGGNPTQAPGTGSPTLPLPSGGGLPSLPLPTLPTLPLPSVPLPSLPLPSLPLPTILGLPPILGG